MLTFTTFKDLRNLALSANTLAFGGGLGLIALFFIVNVPAVKEIYNDDDLVALLLSSGIATAVLGTVVMAAALLNIRFVSNARKACMRLHKMDEGKPMAADLQREMVVAEKNYDTSSTNAKNALWVQLASNVAAWVLNIVLGGFMINSWVDKAEGDEDDEKLIELSILSTLVAGFIFLAQTTVAALVVVQLFNVNAICNKDEVRSYEKEGAMLLGGAKFQSWNDRIRRRIPTVSDYY